MRPPAPTLFSTTTAFFAYAVLPRRSATTRLAASAVPPAGKPLTILACAKAWASAPGGRAHSAPSEAADSTKWRRGVLRGSPEEGRLQFAAAGARAAPR